MSPRLLLLSCFLFVFGYLACGPRPSGDDDATSDDDTTAGDDDTTAGDDDTPTGDDDTGTPPAEDCFGYAFGSVSYMHELTLEMDGSNRCCFDFNGDGTPDNAFGALFNAMVSMDPTLQPNATLEQRVQSGTLCRALEYHNMAGPTQSPSFELALMKCIDSDTDYADNLIGNESFTVTESSFVPGPGVCTSEPVSVFDATVNQGLLEGSSSGILHLTLPFLGTEKDLEVDLNQARISATLVENNFGVAATQGHIGGVIPQMNLWDYFNSYADTQCPCLGITGDLIDVQLNAGSWRAQCQNLSGSTCGPQDPGLCENFTSFCSFMGVFTAVLDIDLDGDGVEDAITVGMSFESTPATVGGVTAGQ